jgi:hypothetical protein
MERKNFGMRFTRLSMIGFADDLPVVDDDGSNHGIGTRAPFPFCREGKGSLHECGI